MRLTSPMSLVMPMVILGISTIQGTAAKCSDGLVNVVFNTGHGGYTQQRWEKIHSNWLTFRFGLEDKQIRMLGNDSKSVQQAIDAVNGPNPPDFMLTFNEPDNLYGSNPRKSYCTLKKPPILLNHCYTNAEIIQNSSHPCRPSKSSPGFLSSMETAAAKTSSQHTTSISITKPSKKPKIESTLSTRSGTTSLCGLPRLHQATILEHVRIPFPGITPPSSCKISTPGGRKLNGSTRYFGTRPMRSTVLIRTWLPRSCLILRIIRRHSWILSIS